MCHVSTILKWKSYTLPGCLWRLHHLIFEPFDLARFSSLRMMLHVSIVCLVYYACCQTSADRCHSILILSRRQCRIIKCFNGLLS
jgi:hypothetical protein